MKRPPLLLRLSAVPLAAGLAVLLLSGISLVELNETRKADGDEDTLQILERPNRENLVPRSTAIPKLSEEEALKALRERPGRAALEALWPSPAHRQRLFEILLAKDTAEEVRLHLLGRFWDVEPKRALEAARAIAGDDGVSQGPLRLSAYEVLAREGEESDLFLLHERPHELHQTKTLREGYRDSLHERVHGGG
jgi:hypothetical protein